MRNPVVGLILGVDSGVMTALAYSEPGPASFLLPTMALAFSVKSLAMSSKVRDVDVVALVLTVGVVVLDETMDMRFMVNSLNICHSIMSGRPCKRSKTASSFE